MQDEKNGIAAVDQLPVAEREKLIRIEYDLEGYATRLLQLAISAYTRSDLEEWMKAAAEDDAQWQILTQAVEKGGRLYRENWLEGNIKAELDITNACRLILLVFLSEDSWKDDKALAAGVCSNLQRESAKTASDERKMELGQKIARLGRLQGKKGELIRQYEEERKKIEAIRTFRNQVAHKKEGAVEHAEDGDPAKTIPNRELLYNWASALQGYIALLAGKNAPNRYELFSCFDAYYEPAGKGEEIRAALDALSNEIQDLKVSLLQIRAVAPPVRFGAAAYLKEDAIFNFRRLIQDMADDWYAGMEYFAVPSADELPELYQMARESLPESNQYVGVFLKDVHQLRCAWEKDSEDDSWKKRPMASDYRYFRLLYHTRLGLDRIYWGEHVAYDPAAFAMNVLYKPMKAENPELLDKAMEDLRKARIWVDLKKWSQERLLSEAFFPNLHDQGNAKLAEVMEDALLFYFDAAEEKKESAYFFAVIAMAQLYYSMNEVLFAYYRRESQPKGSVIWRTKEDACAYLEDGEKFESLKDLCGFAGNIRSSALFLLWEKCLEKPEAKRNLMLSRSERMALCAEWEKRKREAQAGKEPGAGKQLVEELFRKVGADPGKNRWVEE